MSSAPNGFFTVSWRFSTGPGRPKIGAIGNGHDENLPSLQAKVSARVSGARAIGAASKRISYLPLAALRDPRQHVGAVSKPEGERDLVGIGAAAGLSAIAGGRPRSGPSQKRLSALGGRPIAIVICRLKQAKFPASLERGFVPGRRSCWPEMLPKAAATKA